MQTLVTFNRNAHRLRDLALSHRESEVKLVRQRKQKSSRGTPLTRNQKGLSRNLESYNDTLSICLLTKDDDDILPEWLAYHYHVANLRTLIVMVDPTSKKYPTELFEKFGNLLDMEILEWTDQDIMPHDLLNNEGVLDPDKVMGYREQHVKPIKNKWLREQVKKKYLPQNATEKEVQEAIKLIGVHRYRQEYLATKCVNHLRESGRSWVTVLDSDEYIQIGSTENFNNTAVPDMYEQGGVMKWINSVYSEDTSCFKMPWYRYGATNEMAAEVLSQSIPSGFDPYAFTTLRWRFHSGAEHNGKDCLNLERAHSRYFPLEKITNVHILSSKVCGSSYSKEKFHPVSIGHYTGTIHICDRYSTFFRYRYSNTILFPWCAGTWEQYTRRNDVRRTNARQVSTESMLNSSHLFIISYHCSSDIRSTGNNHRQVPFRARIPLYPGSTDLSTFTGSS